MIEDIELIFDSSIRLAATLLLAGLGELIAERAGTIYHSRTQAPVSTADIGKPRE